MLIFPIPSKGAKGYEASAISSFRGEFELLLSSDTWDKTEAKGAAIGKFKEQKMRWWKTQLFGATFGSCTPTIADDRANIEGCSKIIYFACSIILHGILYNTFGFACTPTCFGSTNDEYGKVDPSNTAEGLAHIKGDNTSSVEGPVIEMDDGKFIEHSLQVENDSSFAESPRKNLPSEISLHMSLSSSSNSDPLEANKCGKRNKVAFISVNKPATARSTANNTGLHIKGSENPSDNKEDPIFSLLTRGIMKDSLF